MSAANEVTVSNGGSWRRTLRPALLLIVLFGLLVSMMWSYNPPARNRRPGPLHQGMNRANNLGLAFHNYESGRRHIPPSLTDAERAARGEPLHSWATDLLPLVDRVDLYRTIDRSARWDDPVNRAVFRTDVSAFRHPAYRATRAGDYPTSHFAMNERLWNTAAPVSLKQIADADGGEGTVLLGSVNGAERAWGDTDAARDLTSGINRLPMGFGAQGRRNETIVVLASGRVLTIADDVDPSVLARLADPTDGLPADPSGF